MSKQNTFKSSVIGMQGNLLSFALKLTTDKEEAHDLVQDTTLKALNNEEKFVDTWMRSDLWSAQSKLTEHSALFLLVVGTP